MQMTLIQLLENDSQRESGMDDAIKFIEKIAETIDSDAEIIRPCFNNEFMIKIRTNFNDRKMDSITFKVEKLIQHYFMTVKSRGTILEFPWNTLKQIEKEFNIDNEDPGDLFEAELHSLSIGSLLNLSTFD
ncbi:hypothetical protein BLA29_000315 [Euroglyphus maynei]|uniref:Uncharacterized protein n=1 Tax=Euroglyphus maynei TaxID=6958 RepID=A0A1Y3BDI3_EURMA|nr:hypothetical protein BLA29_000315 [Euroglyphus maynei]